MVSWIFHLAPVVFLMTAFPLASGRMAAERIGDTRLTVLVLASSVTVPWLSQVVCLPLYRGLGSLTVEGTPAEVRRRFCEVWPRTWVRTLPATLLFATVLELVMRLSATALATYVALCLLNGAFAQSLVPGNVLRQRALWATAWAVYAVALVALPTWWFLPPLLALATQLVPLRGYLTARGPQIPGRLVALDLVRGLLLGAVMWSDKLFLYLSMRGHFAVNVVFVALLPAVLAYSYYFGRFAPRLDTAISGFRDAMSAQPHSRLARQSTALEDGVGRAIASTGALGAALCLVTTALLSNVSPHAERLGAVVSVASWFLMMSTLACYKLDYIGARTAAQVLSGAQLVLTVAVFMVFTGGIDVYGALLFVAAPLFLVALLICRARWNTPEYAMFWRHATAW